VHDWFRFCPRNILSVVLLRLLPVAIRPSSLRRHLLFGSFAIVGSSFIQVLSLWVGSETVTSTVLSFQVTLVVNFDLPVKNTPNRNVHAEPDFETYLHRIGRSGRFGRKGRTFPA
jgi:hypothetical protein